MRASQPRSSVLVFRQVLVCPSAIPHDLRHYARSLSFDNVVRCPAVMRTSLLLTACVATGLCLDRNTAKRIGTRPGARQILVDGARVIVL